MTALQTILHPTDFSPQSDHAFGVACSMAGDYGARLILFHVMRPSVAPVLDYKTPNPFELAENQDAFRGRFAWPEPAKLSLQVEHRVAEGDAVEEIVRLAENVHADLIVMGTHGRTGWNRLLTGSVAEGVVRQANCPVMTIRNPPAEAQDAPPPAKLLAQPGEIVNVQPLGMSLRAASTERLAGSNGIEVLRMVLPAGKEIYQYKTGGTLILHCLEGRIAVTAFGKTNQLDAGQLLFLPKDEPHTLKGIEDASLLVTTALAPA
jgi:nucleotide-binding universal stress UspA family protein/quercetin dioxygenase-like cupin family protein